MTYKKYRNKKTTIDGITFSSKGEANRYCELKLLERAGLISDLQLQPKFELQPKFKKDGKTIRAINYIADFQYVENGQIVVEDFKGVITKEFSIKKKMFEYRYRDLELRIVK